MNLYEILSKELEDKNNFNIIDKLNYVYVRLLQLLSHDSRWNYSKNRDLKKYIFDKDINIFNLNDNRVICSSFSKIYTDLVNTLFSGVDDFDISFTEGTSEPHMFSRVFLYDGSSIDYDPLSGTNDFVRAKRNLKINGINIHNRKDRLNNELLVDESLYKIGYRIDEISYLKGLKEILIKDRINTKELMDYLFKIINYEDLDLIELNTFINMQCRKCNGRTLKSYGINFDYYDEGVLTVVDKEKELYREEEDYTKVNVIKL